MSHTPSDPLNCNGEKSWSTMTGWADVGRQSRGMAPAPGAHTPISACDKENATRMVKPLEYLTYRGGPGHWSWILHRLTGIGVFLFLLIHVVDISLIGWGPDVFNRLLFLYRNPVFRVGEVALMAGAIFHAL